MYIKRSVELTGIKPELVLAIMVVRDAFVMEGLDTVVTSVVDSKHSRQSLHYVGYAVDFRISQDFGEQTASHFAQSIRGKLTPEFDVVLEWGDGTAPHLHVEYQPKR